ncbi:MAG: polyphosphate polymerase domain-containing protein [Chitinophagales bacterium]|nr:polyphosphate polymerase domain-containing protein [Chitinophagales bacterium]
MIKRKEIKYLVPIEKMSHLKSIFDNILERDKHGINGTYLVRTQYYDTLEDDDLFDNLSGIIEKKKIRLRTYFEDESTFKLEYKYKYNTDSTKYSLIITRDEAKQMENHKYDFLLNKKSELALFFYYKLLQGCYRPKTIVEYNRLAYMYPVCRVRITFDTNVRATAYPYGLFEERLNTFPIISPDLGVLEVKYNEFLPSSLKHILESIDTLPQANSKYLKARFLL